VEEEKEGNKDVKEEIEAVIRKLGYC